MHLYRFVRSKPEHDDEERSLEDRHPLIEYDAGGGTLLKRDEGKKDIIGCFHPRASQIVFTILRRIPIAKFTKKKKSKK